MSEVFNFIYRGGVKVEDDVRYLTTETPPTDDNSNKVPTTEWVQEKIDDVEAAVSGGMNATVKATTYSVSGNTGTTKSPSGGGTWWCFHEYIRGGNADKEKTNRAVSGGSTVYTYSSDIMEYNVQIYLYYYLFIRIA